MRDIDGEKHHLIKTPTSKLFVDITGKQIGMWNVIRYAGKRGSRHMWLCDCSCGKQKTVSGASLAEGTSASCGCSVRIKEIVGKTFSRLSVRSKLDENPVSSSRYLCDCECGLACIVAGSDLWSRRVQSCGCLVSDSNKIRCTTHGLTRRSEYSVWRGMIRRCYDVDFKSYCKYGGIGIIVCKRWLESAKAFIDDMGPRPSMLHSIDRFPNQSGNYEPGNCRWATIKEQNRNRKSNRLITIGDETRCIAEWSELTGIKAGTLWNRINMQGMTPELAISRPIARH